MLVRSFSDLTTDWLGPLAMLATMLIVVMAALPLVEDGALWNLPGLFVVVVGTVTVTLSTMLGSDLRAFCSGTRNLLFSSGPPLPAYAEKLVRISEQCQRLEMRELDRKADSWRQFGILHHGLLMHMEGKNVDEIIRSVEQQTMSNDHWWSITISAIRRAAETAPAMGLVGTLIGLLGMLGKLANPSEIGPGMALALLTTLYGSFLAYGVLSPLADRLDRLREIQANRMQLEIAAVRSIANRENKRHLESSLLSLLNPGDRMGFRRL